MSALENSSKKPRARKLEKDRARDAETPAKKSSSRHALAKKAASKTREKPAKKRAPRATDRSEVTTTRGAGMKSTRKDKVATTRVSESDGKPNRFERSERAKQDAKNTGPARKSSTGARRFDDRPARKTSSRDFDRDDRPARSRSDRDERPVSRSTRDERPSRSRDDRPATRSTRDDRPTRNRDERPSRDERPVTRSARPVREERTERPPRKTSAPVSRRTERFEEEDVVIEKPVRVAAKKSLESVGEVTTTWAELGVEEALIPVLKRQGILTPFPIQAATLPDAIGGRDVLGRGQTGSGKTLAFGLAMVTKLAYRRATAKHPLGLVLVPTRELAAQVTDALLPFAQAVDLDIRLIAGGMPYAKQIDALKRGVPILVATPGRLNDLVAQGHVNLSKLEITILDEADQMCDMGFTPQIIEVLDLTKPTSQRLLFSATLDADVDKIVRKYLHDPVEHATNTGKASVKTMAHYLFIVYSEDKNTIMAEIASRAGKTMFFARTQAGVDRIANDLAKLGVPAGALHGGKTQAVRTRTLKAFKDGVTNVLVATDVAARGIHVDGVSLVVHVDAPNDPKDYLHRAGRTARAGEEGQVVTLVGPRQQRGVEQMTQRAGVTPQVVKVRSMSREMVAITGAQEPSRIPWKPPAEPAKRGGGRPSAGGRGGSRGASRGRSESRGRGR